MTRPSDSKPGRLAALRLLLFAAGFAAACGGADGTPEIVLAGGAIEIRGLSRGEARMLRERTATPEAWLHHVRIVVQTGSDVLPGVAGRYALEGRRVIFTPLYPFEPGRSYEVRFDRTGLSNGAPVEKVISIPGPPWSPPVRVTEIFPTLDEVPENLLRLYIHFSGRMGRDGGMPHVKILDADGREVVDPFLPVEGEFWDQGHTRYTLFFDPGRVKTGILPNDRMGRPLRRGRRYTLVVSRAWKDAAGKPLVEEFRRTFAVGPAIAKPIVPAAWTIAAPRAGSRDHLRVTFPWRLDRALLERALGVEQDGRPLEGTGIAMEGEREWRFVPAQPWAAGAHQLVVLSILEDPSGNRIGRAFEAEGATRGPAAPDRLLISWSPVR